MSVGLRDRRRAVERIILQLDQVSVVQNRMWDPDFLSQAFGHAAGNGRLTRAGIAGEDHVQADWLDRHVV